MATGTNIKTYFEGQWHDGDAAIMRAGDHGAWLGSSVFDGARFFDGVAPDLKAHCARVNRSAEALMITPSMETAAIVEAAREGLAMYAPDAKVYIRPMYWALDGGDLGVDPKPGSTGFCLCLEEIPMAPANKATTLTTTRFRRPVLEDAVVNAKAGCLYPNNARMLIEARNKGFGNALVADALGNVAETATANIFMVRDGEVTRARHMKNLRDNGVKVHEEVLSFDDFRAADEVFMSGNMMKVTPVTEFDGTHYQHGPVTKQVRDMYWDWALSPCRSATPHAA